MPHGAFYCCCTWKQAQKITLRQSIPQKWILFQPSVVTGNGAIFLFCLLLFAAPTSASLETARGLFCCCLLLEAKNSCAESYRWKQVSLPCASELQYVAPSVPRFKRTIIPSHLLRNTTAWSPHLHSRREPAKLLHLRFSADFYLVPKGGRLLRRDPPPHRHTAQLLCRPSNPGILTACLGFLGL